MAKNRLKFPHISRILTAKPFLAGLKLVVLATMAGFLAINLFPSLSPDLWAFERTKLTVMLFPKDITSHLLLVQEYLKRGELSEVERELTLAQGLVEKNPPTTNSAVLGTSLSPLKILENIKNEPQRIRQEISFWEKVVSEKPDYRDAYLQLAILNHQVYENDKAKRYLKKALDLDPNFRPTKELEKIFGN